MNHRLSLAAASLALAACSSFAQSPAGAVLAQRNISLDLANQIAAGAVAACAANGYAVAATVVDRAGTVRAVQRADNAGPHTLSSSERKAWTSASARNTTLAMMEGAQKNPAGANLVYLVLLVLGGVVFPLTRFSGGARAVLEMLPISALADGLRAVLRQGAFMPGRDLLILAAWSVAGLALAARFFKWE